MTTLADRLALVLREHAPCAVLFSGGNDSEVLLRSAVGVLGSSMVLALTASTPMLAEHYRNRIRSITGDLGIESLLISVNPLHVPEFRANTKTRCYICKSLICRSLVDAAASKGFNAVMDGTTIDDLDEDRPGLIAADEHGILHPFVSAGIGKREILSLGLRMEMSPDLNPSDSCLATRIVPPNSIESGLMELVERLEAPFRSHVMGRLRARILTHMIELEYSREDSGLILQRREELKSIACESGFEIRFREIY